MTKKYISLLASTITEFALVKISIDDKIIEPFSKIKSTGILHVIEVNITWTGVKRISLTSMQGSFTLMHTEIAVNGRQHHSTIIKDNVCLNNQPLITTKIDSDGDGEWHYEIPESSTLTFDLVVK